VKREISQLKREELQTHITWHSFLHEGEVIIGEIKILLEADATYLLKRETLQLKRGKLHTYSTGHSFLHEGEVMTGEIKSLF
jgi:hypothetical protein